MEPAAADQDFLSFARMPILDGHIHVWEGADVSRIWETLERSGAQRCNALSLSRPDRPGTLNEQALRFKVSSNGRAYAFGALDYTAHCLGGTMRPDDLSHQAARLWEQGYDGVKMWEGKPHVYVHLPDRLGGPLFASFFDWMEAQQFPILLHLADPPRFWDPTRLGLDPWSYAGPAYPSRQELYAELERILRRNPRLRLILAHFLFLWGELPEAARFLDAHPSVMFDLTPAVEGYVHLSRNRAAARQFFLRYQDRLIYGTDLGALPLLNPAATFDPRREARQSWLVQAFLETDCDVPFPSNVGVVADHFSGERLCGIALPGEALEKICWRNFERLVGLAPRPV